MKTISTVTAKPFVKWAGGKGQLLSEIRRKYPFELGDTITKYAEPFVGGGAVLFDILSDYCLDEVYIGDINRELITTYLTIRDNSELLIEKLSEMELEYLKADEEKRKEIYYNNRDKFNSVKSTDNSLEIASLFIFLNKTCFNGLYRVNSKGGFNVPQGSYKNPTICDSENLKAVSTLLQGVNIVHGDYRICKDFIDEKTFAYFDPPYRPLTETASFTAYAQDHFDDNSQAELARFIGEITAKGATVLASNSDPKNTNQNDNFFDNLYSKCIITRISANRAINSVGSSRGKVSELLIASNYLTLLAKY
ncbi:MAG: Dam family site-specific DNA-(adenine-N6)-methyltransferase [Oscillospiraceae bacterium]|jgi:DNA adenine methylase|nr:Dam family site-specific DNA-(adenine-N6)-methyltransferase [Oscillospiraceae bacterium]